MIPNLISLLRIVLTFPIGFCVWYENFQIAAVLFFIAGFTDFFDGFFARKLNQESKFGEMLDPIADKVLVVGLIVILGAREIIPLWFAGLIILRDVLILLGGLYLIKIKGISDMPPLMISKLNTTFVLFLIMDIFLWMLWPEEFFLRFKESFIFLVSITTVFSFVVYLKRFFELCKR